MALSVHGHTIKRQKTSPWRPPDGFLDRHLREPDVGTKDRERKLTCRYCNTCIFKGKRVLAHFSIHDLGGRACASNAAKPAMREISASRNASQLTMKQFSEPRIEVNRLQVEAFSANRLMFCLAESDTFRKYIEAVAKYGKPFHMSRKQLGADALDRAVAHNRELNQRWLSSVVACTMTLDSWTDRCTKQTWTAIVLCSQGREYVVDLFPNSESDGTRGHDAQTCKILMRRGLQSIACVIAANQKIEESAAKEMVLSGGIRTYGNTWVIC